jgi:hypothetical protein
MTKNLSAYDIPLSVVNSQEPIAVLVGVHLHLEAFIIALITAVLPKPDALDIDRLNFPSKLGLAVALGAIPDAAAPALRTINSLRNRIAHNLRAELTEEDSKKLRGELGFIMAAQDSKLESATPSQRIALCALVLQAWLNGVVAGRSRGEALSGEELENLAKQRYPDSRESQEQ